MGACGMHNTAGCIKNFRDIAALLPGGPSQPVSCSTVQVPLLCTRLHTCSPRCSCLAVPIHELHTPTWTLSQAPAHSPLPAGGAPADHAYPDRPTHVGDTPADHAYSDRPTHAPGHASGHLPAGSTPAAPGGPGTAAEGPCPWQHCSCWPPAPLAAGTPSASGPAWRRHLWGWLPAAGAAAACSKKSCLRDVACRVDSSHICEQPVATAGAAAARCYQSPIL